MNAGETIRSIAAALAIAPSCVSKWKKRLAETGALTRGRVGGRKQRPWPATGPTGGANAADQARPRRGALWRSCSNAASKPERRAVWVFVRAEGLGFKKGVLPTEQMANGSMLFQPMKRPIGRKSLASPAPKRPKVQRPIPRAKSRPQPRRRPQSQWRKKERRPVSKIVSITCRLQFCAWSPKMPKLYPARL